MKIQKLWAAAILMLTSLSLSSCFSSDADNTLGNGVFAVMHQAVSGYYFTTADGKTIYPTSESVNSIESNSGSLAVYVDQPVYAYFQWEESQGIDYNGSTKLTELRLNTLVPLQSSCEICDTAGESNDSIATNPIIGIGVDNSGSTVDEPFYFAEGEVLILPINYWINVTHYLTLVYYRDENQTSSVPVVHLRNTAPKGDDTYSTSSCDLMQQYAYNLAYVSFYYKGYQIGEILNEYTGQTGRPANTIKIVYDQLSNLNELDQATSQEKTINLESIVVD